MLRIMNENFVADAYGRVPECGLGKFVADYTDEPISYNWFNILWNIIPIVGQFLFILSICFHFTKVSNRKRVLIYERGVVVQKISSDNSVKSQEAFDFTKLQGLRYNKVARYTSTYGVTTYRGTSVTLSILDEYNTEKTLLKGMYKNEDELPDEYNAIGYACHEIINRWAPFELRLCNDQLARTGYATFVTGNKRVKVSRNSISVNDRSLSTEFTYKFRDGMLYLSPTDKKLKKLSIDVRNMYNSHTFMVAMAQFFGVK